MTWSYILNADHYIYILYIYINSIDLVLYPNNEHPQMSTVTMHIVNSIFMFRYTHPFFIGEILIWGVPIMGGTPIAGWFMKEKTIEMYDLGIPPFYDTSVWVCDIMQLWPK